MKYPIGTILILFCLIDPVLAGDEKGNEPVITVDVPVQLKRVDVVYNMSQLVLRGDVPLGLRYMDLLSRHLRESAIEGHVIGVFHHESAHLTLNDKAYNAYRGVATGNPHKELIGRLMQQGVQIEECAESMRNHRWTNADLLPGVKVNTGATRRIIELVQKGYVQMQP